LRELCAEYQRWPDKRTIITTLGNLVLNGLLIGWGVEDADALLDIVYQAGAALIGGEVPDQDPSNQDGHRHEPDKGGYFFIGLETCDSSTIGGVRPVKKTDDLEERTIEKFNPPGKRFSHDIIYA
jgi:hypothetical protein